HDLKSSQKHRLDQRLGVTTTHSFPQTKYQTPQQTSIQPEITGKTIFCIHCGKPNPNYASFCAFCGKNLQKQLIDEAQQTGEKTTEIHETQNVCQNCGKPPRKLDDKFCQYCGYKYG
ncbi:MAG: double zinc ribbon domain-containing protein, partial [Candidatus Hodarchaeales archaeon]